MSRDRHEWFLNQVFRHRAELKNYLRKIVSQGEEVEDLIQETYLRIYGVSDFAGVSSPKALLLKIAHNLAIERLRRRSSQATDNVADFDALDLFAAEPSLDEQLDARRRFELFCAAVDSLPPVCRRAFVLRKVYKLSQTEIAEVLGIAQSTIEKHVVKGLIRCRDYLREHGVQEKTNAGGPVGAAVSVLAARLAMDKGEHS
jgi:RNA polymerase sigma factor (sigma-70 family)